MKQNPTFENELVIGTPSIDDEGNQYTKTLIGSYVIIPKSYVSTPFELSEQEWRCTQEMMHTIKQHLDEVYSPDGYNIGWNVGPVAGQTVGHAHMHIIPRFENDGIIIKSTRPPKMGNDEIAALAEKFRISV